MSLIDETLAVLSQAITGKPQQLRQALCCVLAGGHLLIEDVPGMGKTTLAHGLAKVMGLNWRRIQFTSDLLPADILGVSVFDRNRSAFHFQPGPVFTQLLLADEINRATPRTQSALLEAMEEGQVSVEGESRPLPQPFFVIATRNPVTQSGTFPLPESQLDRFLMRVQLGYPDPAAEKAMLVGEAGRVVLDTLKQVMTAENLQKLQDKVQHIQATDRLLDYLQRLVSATREGDRFECGLSPRAALGLLSASRAWAFMAGRDYVLPEDIQAVFPAVAGHRLQSRRGGGISNLLAEVDVTGAE
ncbi:MoxR family ATPase [Sansalvadorimonas sp. 2012CJ34-2]|uniref:MoxR family ATPase n=1 Tax=Parendozoicomonas callyspongiae TaxID=2942213 RepID=A0ABT0PBS4_9GAMM|nr:MoxR family ATPase [Sansalvadorimonas sp. 2012CJ34-2]MCL6268701.1 MoxR family ATPase [Sansalvadorimonas sp. 2012CJ34-2]